MTAHDVEQPDEWDFEPIDGVHELHQRRLTRLWYRSLPPQSIKPAWEVRMRSVDLLVSAPEAAPIDDQLAEIAQIALAAGRRQQASSESALLALHAPETPPAPLDEAGFWSVAPANCPALMLSVSPALTGQFAAENLSPGSQYRIVSVSNGVALVEVLGSDGAVVGGYCNTVDLACINSAFAGHRSGSGNGARAASGKFRLAHLSQAFGGLR